MKNTNITIKLFLSMIFLCFSTISISEATEYTGNLIETGSGSTWLAEIDIPLQLDATSFMEFSYSTAVCQSLPGSLIRLRRNNDDGSTSTSNVFTFGDEGETSHRYPIASGDYTLTVRCKRYAPSEPYSLNYTVSTTQSMISLPYTEDSEPDATPESPIYYTETEVIEGWIGGYGYPETGLDQSDTYFIKLEEPTDVRLKLEYDPVFKDNPFLTGDGGGDLQIHISVYNPDHAFPGNMWTPIDNWTSSGFITDPFPLYYNGGYVPNMFGLIVKSGGLSYSGGARFIFGSYKLTILKQGNVPEPDFKLTYPAGRSPKVFTNGWVFGAVVTYQDENGNTVDISDQVRWQGTGKFSPATGSRSYPAFHSEGQNTIKLSVTIDGKTFNKEYQVEAVSSLAYARLGDQARAPADAHGCLACPHPVMGPITSGSPNVSIQGLPAARVGDVGIHAACCGSNRFAVKTGDGNVLIDGRPAAKIGDETAHCGGTGRIITGSLLKNDLPAVLKNCSITPETPAKVAGGTVSGKVTDSNMNGIHGVGVNAYGETRLDVWGTVTNEHGEYSIAGLPDDTFRIHFWGGNLSYNDGYLSSWYNKKTGMSSADSITINGSNAISDINATLSAGGGISGTVTDEHGNGIKQITVGAYGESGDNAWGFTDENGEYRIGGLKDDTYRVQCLAENMDYISEWYNNAASQSTATPVVVASPAQVLGINCALATAGKITGTVTDETRKNIAGVYVKAFGQSTGKTGIAKTDQNGMFEILGIPSDSYRVQFDGESSGYKIIWYKAYTGWDGAKLVPVTMSQSTDGIDAQLKKLGFSWPIFFPAFTRPRQE